MVPVAEMAPLAEVCRVWWAPPSYASTHDIALLDRFERQRLDSFRLADNRARFLCAAILLRRLVSVESGIPPERLVVDRSCATCRHPHGRPRLTGLDLHVSITHSGCRVGVALTRAGPVGLDVEEIARLDILRLATRVLGEGERVSGPEDFYRYWTRKESVVKATGAGIGVGLRRVRVSEPHAPPRLLSYPGRPSLVATMHDLSPGDGYTAAVTVLGTGSCPVDEHWCGGAEHPGAPVPGAVPVGPAGHHAVRPPGADRTTGVPGPATG